jgi:hypothetical protein
MTTQEALKNRSGSVTYSSKLVSFLYGLLRDHLPAGSVEELVEDSQVSEVTYTNGWLAQYAQDVADRLKDEVPPKVSPKDLSPDDLQVREVTRVLNEAVQVIGGWTSQTETNASLGTLKALVNPGGHVIAYIPIEVFDVMADV